MYEYNQAIVKGKELFSELSVQRKRFGDIVASGAYPEISPIPPQIPNPSVMTPVWYFT